MTSLSRGVGRQFLQQIRSIERSAQYTRSDGLPRPLLVQIEAVISLDALARGSAAIRKTPRLQFLSPALLTLGSLEQIRYLRVQERWGMDRVGLRRQI